jgi:hypothetical protein
MDNKRIGITFQAGIQDSLFHNIQTGSEVRQFFSMRRADNFPGVNVARA